MEIRAKSLAIPRKSLEIPRTDDSRGPAVRQSVVL
jgi:hypothetical protein